MNIREISKPVTAKALNESLAKRFGKRIALETFTLEQLQNAQNKLRTDLFNVETTESFNSVQREAYQKSKLFLDVLNAEIAERENIGEGAKPDFLDMDKDGDKKEPMKKAIADKKAKKGTKNKNWIQGVNKSIKKRGTKGKCTPITKKGCTGRAKALAKTFKKMAKGRKK